MTIVGSRPPKSEISRPSPATVAVQPGLCQTWSGTPKPDFRMTRFILCKCPAPSVLPKIKLVTFDLRKNKLWKLDAKLLAWP